LSCFLFLFGFSGRVSLVLLFFDLIFYKSGIKKSKVYFYEKNEKSQQITFPVGKKKEKNKCRGF